MTNDHPATIRLPGPRCQSPPRTRPLHRVTHPRSKSLNVPRSTSLPQCHTSNKTAARSHPAGSPRQVDSRLSPRAGKSPSSKYPRAQADLGSSSNPCRFLTDGSRRNAPFVRHAPTRIRHRHPHRPKPSRPCRRLHDHDLPPPHQTSGGGRSQPPGQSLKFSHNTDLLLGLPP